MNPKLKTTASTDEHPAEPTQDEKARPNKMTDTNMEQALLNATIEEIRKALEDPNINTADHILDKSRSLDEGTVNIDLAPGKGPNPIPSHGTWTDDDGRSYPTTTFDLNTPTTVRMNFTTHAKASLDIRNRAGEWITRELTPEQQEVLDQYAAEGAFWVTGIANGALGYTDENPADYPEGEELDLLITELDQEDIRRLLESNALACIGLARRAGATPDNPDAAYLDAAMTIRLAGAKLARANQHTGLRQARKYHESRRSESRAQGTTPDTGAARPSNQLHLELERPTNPDLIRQVLEDAGIPTLTCRQTNADQEGYAIIEETARDIWEQESGHSQCQGQCEGQATRHHAWDELHEDQRIAFLSEYAMFIEECRTEDLHLHNLLSDRREFLGILTHSHS